MRSLPQIGSTPPDLSLPDQEGRMHTLSEHIGSWVLIYFYPKDDTPGCTKEACVLRDAFPDFNQLNAIVFGISADSVKSHKKFVEKYALPFTLLADEDRAVSEAYGVWGEKKFMGKIFNGIKRTSFLINPEGNIAKVYENVKPAVHAGEVLADIREVDA